MGRNPPHISLSTSDASIPTAGLVFRDGTLIELVDDRTQPSGLGLLKWNGRKCEIASRVVADGRTYTPLTLHPGLRRALRLPSTCSPFGSTTELFEGLVVVARKFTDLPTHLCEKLVVFVLASWLADRLPAPINLSLWCPVASDGAQVLRLLSCFCRQALPLSGTSARELYLLPPELQATLLIFRPASGRRTRELLSTCGWRGFYNARAGQFNEFAGSVALSTDAPLRDHSLDTLEIPVCHRRCGLPFLAPGTQVELANEFLPKLLSYRLLHFRTDEAEASHQDFSGPSSQLAVGLHVCFSGEPKLRDQQLALLAEADQSAEEGRLIDPLVPVVEVLLARCHERGRAKLYVAEVAADLNAVFSLSGHPELSCRMVGELLKALGLSTAKLDRQGRGIGLTLSVRKLIHRLALTYSVSSVGTFFASCPECSPGQIVET